MKFLKKLGLEVFWRSAYGIVFVIWVSIDIVNWLRGRRNR